jgi:phosphonate transport system substrate-binding protein
MSAMAARPPARLGQSWRRVLWVGVMLACVAAWRGAMAAPGPEPIRFGILPIGSAAESREQWAPLLEDIARRLDHPVSSVSVSSYAGLSNALATGGVDIAFVSGRLAVEAVSRQHMHVVAQFVRDDGVAGNYALLIVRASSPIQDVDSLLANPGRWRYARGEPLSVTGYVAPEAQLFAPRGINSDTFFASVRVGNHQDNALAVVNREADVASGNNPDLDLFTRHFPHEAAQLRVIWRSALIPAGVLVVRDAMPQPLQDQLVALMRNYGKLAGAGGERERANLSRIPDLAHFIPADNRALRPFVDMDYTLARQQAEHGRWVNDAARQARLKQVEGDYRKALQALDPAKPPSGSGEKSASVREGSP